MKPKSNLLLWCVGISPDIAAELTPSERLKMKIIGATLFIPTIMALFSGGYAIYTIFDSNQNIAIIGGLIWASVIFMIDRALVAAIKNSFWSIASRVVTGLIISLSISEPLVLQIFHDAITEEQADVLKNKSTRIDSLYEARIEPIRREIEAKRIAVDTTYSLSLAEMNGTRGTGRRGHGESYDITKAESKRLEAEFKKLDSLDNARITALEKQRDSEKALVQQTAANGLLGRMQSLGRLSANPKDDTVFWSVWVVRILFLLIEMLPLLIKLTSIDSKSLYISVTNMKNNHTEIAFEKTSKARIEVRVREQKNQLLSENLSLQFDTSKQVTDSSLRHLTYEMDQLKAASELKMKFQLFAVEKIKDMILQKQVLAQIEALFEGHITTVTATMRQSQLFHQTLQN